MTQRRARQSGFTLIELVVATFVLVFITGQVMLALTTQQRTSKSQERTLDAQQDARLALDLMLADARMGGFMVPRSAGLASRDGGATQSDALCASDPGRIAEARLLGASARFDRAGLVAPVGAGATSVPLVAAEMDIDQDGNVDFAPNAGIILADGAGSFCGRITGLVGNLVQFTPATPPGFNASLSTGRAVPAILYEVTPAGLTRNGLLLSAQVEDVQVQFGVDVDADGRVGAGEFPIDDLLGFDPSQIRFVQLAVTARTTQADLRFQGAGFSGVANRAAGAADDFRRRRFVSRAVPRNLQ